MDKQRTRAGNIPRLAIGPALMSSVTDEQAAGLDLRARSHTVNEANRCFQTLRDSANQELRRLDEGKADAYHITASVKADYQASFGEFILCEAPAAGFKIVLPRATKADAGKRLFVKNVTSSTNAVTLIAVAAQIDGAPTYAINTAYGGVGLMTDGQNWWKVG